MNITTDKEAFEYVKEQLLKQKQKSVFEDTCAYRGYSEDLKNAVAREFFNCGYDEALECDDEVDCTDNYEILRDAILEIKPDLMCAVGHLIKDSFYQNGIENLTAEDPDVIEVVSKSNPDWHMDEMSQLLLKKLQIIHDTKNVEDWARQFDLINFSPDGSYKGS